MGSGHESEKKRLARKNKLIKRRGKLAARKSYILKGLRKYDINIQRAVTADLRCEIADIECELDLIDYAKIGEKIRHLPLGAHENNNTGAGRIDHFGFWRADNNSLINIFGGLRKDRSEYIDELRLPDLFAGPFIYHNDEENSDISYMLLIDEAGYVLKGGAPRIIMDIIVRADDLIAEREAGSVSRYALAYERAKDIIQIEANRRIDTWNRLPEIMPDTGLLYSALRLAISSCEAKADNNGLSEKDMKTVKRLKRYYSVKKYGGGLN